MSAKTMIVWLSISVLILAESTAPAENSRTANPRSYREIVGRDEPALHSKGQLRIGYIGLDDKSGIANGAESFATGGHLHLYSKRYFGWTVGIEGYFVKDMGASYTDNPDFFDGDGDGFMLLSQAYIDGKWGNTEIKIGRQLLDTPHADSDDIRMMPNYFEAAVLTNSDIEGLKITLGYINAMAGWENGIDSSHFVPVEDVFGAGRDTGGIVMASAAYAASEGISLQGWYYHMDDIADLGYFEIGYELKLGSVDLTLGVQYDTASECGMALTGGIDSSTLGLSVEAALKDSGLTLLAAYNKEFGSTGAFGSLGGGPFFTSLEDQTIDAVGTEGYAWTVGAGLDLSIYGIDGLKAGIVYGRFRADRANLYDTSETDIAAEYETKKHFGVSAAYAMVDDKLKKGGSYNQFRIILNFNF